MKLSKFLPLFVVASLTACSYQEVKYDTYFCFDTTVAMSIKTSNKTVFKELKNILSFYDKICDNYEARDIFNVYSLNHTNEVIYFDESKPVELYEIIESIYNLKDEGATYFNPLCGSLAKKWKDALVKKEVLDSATIQEELDKMNSSSLVFGLDGSTQTIQRVGDAELDLGAVAKGFALDACLAYLKNDQPNIVDYVIDAGSSSILLGENTRYTNPSGDKNDYKIKVKDLKDTYFTAHNCFISTSGSAEQGVEINGVTYSHIVNPFTGNVIPENDTVIVLSECGYYGDALSTSMVFNTVEEIKEIEKERNVQAIVIKNHEIIYKNDKINVMHG